MQQKVQVAKGRIERFVRSPTVILLSFLISIASFAFAINANAQTANEAKREAAHSQAQANHLRVVVCGIVEPYASDPDLPATPGGRALKKSFQAARSPAGADCTPDPYDGK